MEFDLGEEKNDIFKHQLHLLFEQYKRYCKTEKGGIKVFHYEPTSEENKKIFGDDEPKILKNIQKILNAIPLFGKNNEIKIYKIHRSAKFLFEPDSESLVRVFLPIGDNGFIRNEISHGKSTGRGLKIVKELKGGMTLVLQPNQTLEILGDTKAEVFIKGKGRTQLEKNQPFEQYIIYFVMKMDEKVMKTMKDELLKSNGDINTMLKNKLTKNDFDFDLEKEMEKFKSKEKMAEVKLTTEEEEFMA